MGIEGAVLRCEAFVLFDGEASDEAGFGGVALGGVAQLQSVGRTVVEGDARQGDRRFLVGEGDGTEFAFVELSAGEVGHLGVHAPLAREVVATIGGDALDEAFEKRAPTIRHTHSAQFGFGDEAFGGRLLHDGRQLAVVADQHKTIDERPPVGVRHDEWQEVWLEELGGFVDDGQREMLAGHLRDGRTQREGSAHHHAHVLHQLLHLVELLEGAGLGIE